MPLEKKLGNIFEMLPILSAASLDGFIPGNYNKNNQIRKERYRVETGRTTIS